MKISVRYHFIDKFLRMPFYAQENRFLEIIFYVYDVYLAHNIQRAFSLVEVALNRTPFHLITSLFFSILLLLLLQQLLTIQVNTILL